MNIYHKERAHQRVDKKKLMSVCRRLAKCLEDIDDLGLNVFGGTRRLQIRGDGELVIATFDECEVSGGCGATSTDEDGLMRGEQ